jgi:hypothetical protein
MVPRGRREERERKRELPTNLSIEMLNPVKKKNNRKNCAFEITCNVCIQLYDVMCVHGISKESYVHTFSYYRTFVLLFLNM